jgi:hypothetical protein
MITSVVLKTEAGGHAGPGWLKDAAGAAQRGAGEPVLSGVRETSAHGARLAPGKIGGTAHP